MAAGADAGRDRTCHPNGDTFPTEMISLIFEPFKADTGDVQLNGLNLLFRNPAYSGRPGMA